MQPEEEGEEKLEEKEEEEGQFLGLRLRFLSEQEQEESGGALPGASVALS